MEHFPVYAHLMLIFSKLVENEEFIGTLLECNERVIASLQMYDKVSSSYALVSCI